jgi:branched-chain amino acid transport system substrate-binding protein
MSFGSALRQPIKWVGAAILGGLCACSLALDHSTVQCTTTADCVAKGEQFKDLQCSAQNVCVPSAGCKNNAACIALNNGAPFLCFEDAPGTPKTCHPVLSPECQTVYSEPEDIANDDTVWIGSVFDMKDDAFGTLSANSVDMARREFHKLGNGLPGTAPGKPRRPLAVLQCDSAADEATALKAAQHIVKNVHPAGVIGVNGDSTFINMATEVTVPANVLTCSGGGVAAQIDDIPDTATTPRGLVFRTYPSDLEANEIISKTVAGVWEKQLHAENVVAAGESIRVAVAYPSTTIGVTGNDIFTKKVMFNGKSAAANGDTFYLSKNYGDPQSATFKAQRDSVIAEIVKFKPHVVVLLGAYESSLTDAGPASVFTGIEDTWTETAFKPRYIGAAATFDYATIDTVMTPHLAARQRLIIVNSAINLPLSLSYDDRYNAIFASPKISPPDWYNSYDCMYAIVYGVIAAKDKPLTGPNMAEAFATKINGGPGSTAIDVDPVQIFTAYSALSADKTIGLNGLSNSLHWDEKGGTRGNYEIQCISLDDKGVPSVPVGAGVKYDPLKADEANAGFVGTLACP